MSDTGSGVLGIVIVNYGTADLAIDCLRSLAPEVIAVPGARAVVVDSDSRDGSASRLAEAIAAGRWDWASVVALAENRGFSAGNNAGIRHMCSASRPPRYFLLLNPDTFVRPGALRALVDFAEQHPQAGIVGARLEHPDGTPQRSAFRFHSIASELDRGLRLGVASRLLARWSVVLPLPEAASRVDWVSGASLLVRREVLEDVGTLDEGYFLYFEEVDLCRRAARVGWQCWYEPKSRVVHLAGQSTGVDPMNSARRVPPYVLESRRRYFTRNHGIVYAAMADLAWFFGHVAWRARMRLQRRPERAEAGVLKDFLLHSVLVRGRES